MPEYDRERFESMPDPELVCPICHCILDNPHETLCRHVFCKTCIETWIKSRLGGTGESNRCPTCRKYLHIADIKPALPLLCNLISKLRVKCINYGNGCQVIVAKELITQHEKSCDYESNKCRNIGCGKTYLRKDKDKHDAECEMKLELCPKECELMITRRDKKDHNCIAELKKRLKDKESELRQSQDMINNILSGQVRSMANAVRQNTHQRPNIAAEIFSNVRNHIQSYARAIAHDRESTARFASSLMSSLQSEQEPNSPEVVHRQSSPYPDREYSPTSTYSPGYNPTPEYSPSSPNYSPPNEYRAEYRPTPIPRYSPYSPPRHSSHWRRLRRWNRGAVDLDNLVPLFPYVTRPVRALPGLSNEDEDGDDDQGSYAELDSNRQSTSSSSESNIFEDHLPNQAELTDPEISDVDITGLDSPYDRSSIQDGSDESRVSDHRSDSGSSNNSRDSDHEDSDHEMANDNDNDGDDEEEGGAEKFEANDNTQSQSEEENNDESDASVSANYYNSDGNIEANSHQDRWSIGSTQQGSPHSPNISFQEGAASVHSISDDSNDKKSTDTEARSSHASDEDGDGSTSWVSVVRNHDSSSERSSDELSQNGCNRTILFISNSSEDVPDSSQDTDREDEDGSKSTSDNDDEKEEEKEHVRKDRRGPKWSRMRSPASSSESSSFSYRNSYRNKAKSDSEDYDSDHGSSNHSHDSGSSSDSADDSKTQENISQIKQEVEGEVNEESSDGEDAGLEKMSEGSFEPDYTDPESDIEILEGPSTHDDEIDNSEQRNNSVHLIEELSEVEEQKNDDEAETARGESQPIDPQQESRTDELQSNRVDLTDIQLTRSIEPSPLPGPSNWSPSDKSDGGRGSPSDKDGQFCSPKASSKRKSNSTYTPNKKKKS